MESIKKKDGFRGQKAIVVPRQILNGRVTKNPVINGLYITDIGYYPKAKFHYRQRLQGADQHILVYCQEGGGSVTIGKNTYGVAPGDFFVIPGKTAHSYAAAENNPWTIYWIHFKGPTADEIISCIDQKIGGKGFIKYNEKCIGLFNEIYNQLERGYASDTLLYVNMCLWQFLASFLFNEKSDSAATLSSKDAIDIVIDYLGKNIDKVLTLEAIAGQVNLSPPHFSFLFKKKTGFSPIEYFNHLKVQKACQYLLFTTLRIKEIAMQLGIADQYYFSRMFSKVMGMPPNEYREKRIH